MLHMIEGCKVPNPAALFEGYQKIPAGFVANVDATKLLGLFRRFVEMHGARCFLILEVPTNRDEEPEDAVTFHKDVYYLDGMTPEAAIGLLDPYGQLLVHDGMSSFGIGIHGGGHEIFAGKYNVVTVYTRQPEAYQGFFEGLDIPRVEELVTAWDQFTEDTPGETFLFLHEGMDIYGLVEELKRQGLYFAERRADWTCAGTLAV